MAAGDAIASTESICDALHRCGEHFAAGYMLEPGAPPVVRIAQALCEFYAGIEMPRYTGEDLYPCTVGWYSTAAAVQFHYSSGLVYNRPVLLDKLEHATCDEEAEALRAVDEALRDYPGVGGYTHSIPNYRRVLAEGLDSYEGRIRRVMAAAQLRKEPARVALCRALLILLDGIRMLVVRATDAVRAADIDPGHTDTQARLAAALERSPLAPAASFHDAVVATNFVLYLDGPDDLGRLDQDLLPYYEADKAAGRADEASALALIGQLWRNIDLNGAWNVALGGMLEDGTTAINELTHICVKAGEGMRRPNLALRIHREGPETIWDAALDCISHGSGIPALYNEEGYLAAIRGAHLGVSEADLPDFAFGGCTELMVHGKSNCGSLEGDINLPLVLVSTLWNRLPGSASFAEFVECLKADLAAHIRELTGIWDQSQQSKAAWHPQPIRSLLIDDCIDNGREYNDGGARYNWCVINVMGLANVIDSLAAVNEIVFERAEVTAAELVDALRSDFEGNDTLRRRLEACPRFGNGVEHVDDIARDISGFVFAELRRYAPWRGGRYIPSCLMFVTYAMFGKPVAATPDGRRAGEPIADSAGAMQGRDRNGPTSLLRSVTQVRHDLAPGTLVVNARFARSYFRDPESRANLIALIKSYFSMGGLQLQINVVDQAVLQDAMDHPERHGDLIIRVGGYSEYWTNLDVDLRRSILERTEHD